MLFLLLFAIQPDPSLFGKLDAVYDSQVAKVQAEITASKGDQRKTAQLKQELASLTKTFAITIPMFEFDKGVKVGDIGTLAYYMEWHKGDFGNELRKTIRGAEVVKVKGDAVELKLLGNKGEHVVIVGLKDESLVEEKQIHLFNYKLIYEYKGKYKGTDTKHYKVVGNEADFKAWQKSRTAKK